MTSRRYSDSQLDAIKITAYGQGLKDAELTLKAQKEALHLDQVKAVTDLIRATTENLSKAGYLIGKLNKDNSR